MQTDIAQVRAELFQLPDMYGSVGGHYVGKYRCGRFSPGTLGFVVPVLHVDDSRYWD